MVVIVPSVIFRKWLSGKLKPNADSEKPRWDGFGLFVKSQFIKTFPGKESTYPLVPSIRINRGGRSRKSASSAKANIMDVINPMPLLG
uniref:Uncharacterized protein n=1 Tax=Candidatus Kentrum sp. TUN TaxID=2126343 RepID=A0A450ZID5_9GAMM|nr:MAG: hypothetical protein BECKTUN1418D_GA0071000_101319 [Candidatus Kentron sp. TUN]VFK53566.1 MAG: hypothetical protein BECKTUN1418F_GA0071002_102416 [Candidatus Kentron sp. TUN]VFK55010.1 MAG: hypothetical protein BECKTUN1418E_GA0071001_102416 [Candidatus Kentron sp. TUN]